MDDRIIKELFNRVVAVPSIVIKAFGSVKLAVLWSQLFYWKDKTTNKDGWIYKTREQLFDEVGLSRREQETARDLGEKLGVMESKRMGQPCTVHFRINVDRAVEVIKEYMEKTGQKIEEKKPVKPLKQTSSIDYLRAIPETDLAEICGKYSVNKSFVFKRADDVIDYCEAKGKSYNDYKAALRNFIKTHIAKHPECVEKKQFKIEDMPKMSDEQIRKNRQRLTDMKKDLMNNGTLS